MNLLRKNNGLFPVFFLLLFTGCASYYPQVVDIPLIKEKGDTRINAGFFIVPSPYDDDINVGGHGTFSRGITDFLSVQTYASFDGLFRFHLQGALGVFKGFENNAVIELYAGYGYGTGSLFGIIAMDNYQITFAQFNIGKINQNNSKIDYGLGLKGGYVYNDYKYYNENYTYLNIESKYGWMAEPSVFIRVGGNRVKYNLTVNYLWLEHIAEGYYFPVSIGMGVNIRLGNKK